MKKLHLLILLSVFILPLISNSQNSHLNQFTKTQENWLLDSIFEYKNSEIKSQHFTRIKTRNQYSFPLLEEMQSFNFESQEYEFFYSYEYDYPLDNDTSEYSYILEADYDWDYHKIHYYFNYNDNGYRTTVEKSWQNDQWIDCRMEKSKYTNYYVNYEHSFYMRDNENQEWQLYRAYIGFLNEDSTLISRFNFETDNDGYDTTHATYSHLNENGLQYLKESFNKNDGIWIIDNKTIYSYADNNNLISIESFRDYHGELINDRKSFYSYDANNYISLKSEYEWDKNDEIWEYEEQISYIKDSNGNVNTKIQYDEIGDSLWVKDHKWEYIYNESNKILNKKKYSIYEDSIWIPNTNTTYTFHNDMESSYLYQVWDETLNTYRDHMSHEYEFDEFDRITSYKYYYTNTPPYILELQSLTNTSYVETDVHLLKTMNRNSLISGDTLYLKREYYNKYVTNVDELKPNEFKIFPNPTTETLTISSRHYNSQNIEYEILNTSAQVLKTGSINTSGIINVNNLSSGIYLLKVLKPNKQEEIIKFQKL